MPDDAARAREEVAAQIHEVYRATAKRLGWPMLDGVDVPYDQLPLEDLKELDRAFADWHLAALRAYGDARERQQLERDCEVMYGSLGDEFEADRIIKAFRARAEE